MNNLIVVHKVSKKEGKEPFHYLVLQADMGYGKVQLSMDKSIIAEFVGCGVVELMSMKVDEPLIVGNFQKIAKK